MALSVPLPAPLHTSTPWDRTLPNPAALVPHGVEARRSSSLLQHHISSDQFMAPAADLNGRNKSLPYHPPFDENEKALTHSVEGYVNQHQTQALSEDSMTDVSSEGASHADKSYCLCQPEPKIPRPRNAFILYRQHQHASAVAQHPGLPNPEISKIIGEQWRQLSPKEKNEWQALAEQEKARHSQQFPNYRYQPKRNGKFQSIDALQEVTNHPTNCSKCGGKTMNAPNTHYPAYEHAPVTPVVGMPRPSKRGYAEANAPPPQQRPSLVQVSHPAYGTPVHYAYNPAQPRRESVQYVTQPARPPPPQQRVMHEDPEAKRRRLNVSYPSRPAYDQQYYERERPTYHRESIARPMHPPIHRPSHPAPPPTTLLPPGAQLSPRRDPTLTLPPLKTGVSNTKITSPKSPPKKADTEAMIMSHPLLTKLKTLSSITPYLATPGPSSSPFEVRGVMIAIEGLDAQRVDDMTNTLFEQLEKEGKFHVRTFHGPNLYKVAGLESPAGANSGNEPMSHANYLSFMSQWHKVNEEVVDFITHKPGKVTEIHQHDQEMTDVPDSNLDKDAPIQVVQKDTDQSTNPYKRSNRERSPISAVSPRTVDRTSTLTIGSTPSRIPSYQQATEKSSVNLSRVTRSRVPQSVLDSKGQKQSEDRDQSPPPPPPPASTRPITPPPPPTPKPIVSNVSHLTPVALIPHYQLTTVDTCSMALPITDNYDPLTHWRWHATLWRGCTGPDISIVIQNNHDEDSEANDGKKSATLPQRNINAMATESQPHRHGAPLASTSAAQPTSAPSPAQTQPKIQQPSSSAAPVQPHPSHPSGHPPPAPFSVDVRLQDYRAVIIRTRTPSHRKPSQVENTDDKTSDKDNENWEKAKRRVGFEVEEWMRR